MVTKLNFGPVVKAPGLPLKTDPDSRMGQIRSAIREMGVGQYRTMEQIGTAHRSAGWIHRAAELEKAQVSVRKLGDGTMGVWCLEKTST